MDCILCGAEFEAHDGPCPECGWNPDAVHDAKSLRPGELIRGRYEVVSNLGVGRLGAAFLVADTESGEDVVLKLVHPGLIGNEQIGGRFLNGMRSLRKAGHPSMVRVLDANCEAQSYFVVSELVEGIPLRDLMNKRRDQGKGFSLREIRPVLQQIAGFFRDSGVAEHGALSPENVWIRPNGLMIHDVGWAKHLPAAAIGYRLASRGNARAYVAPEVLGGAGPTARSDVYSVGALVCEMFLRRPLAGGAEAFAALADDLPPDLAALLGCALAAHPGARYATVIDFELAMGEIGDSVSQALPLPAPRPPERSAAPLPRPPVRAGSGAAQLPRPPTRTGSGVSPLPRQRPSVPPPRPRTTLGPARPQPPAAENTVQVVMEEVIREYEADEPPDAPAPPQRPTAPPPRAIPWARIAPKRPERKDSIPPQAPPARHAPPPRAIRADADDEGGISRERGAPPRRGHGAPAHEGTQEIDLEAMGGVEAGERVSEGTQEIDVALIEDHAPGADDAAEKLERQAEAALRSTTEELIRRAGRLDGVDPRFVRAAHALEAEKRGAGAAKAAEVLKNRGENLDGIDPRLLRAAARLEEAKIKDVPEPSKVTNPEEEWRERLSQTEEDSVISFLASPVVEPAAEVRGFPRTQQRKPQNRPPAKPAAPAAPPPVPPPARRQRKPGETLARALYDEDGETDDQSQPTMLVHPAQLPRSGARVAVDRRLLYVELALPVAAGLLFAGMIILLAVAATVR